jgi:hypothetical protein
MNAPNEDLKNVAQPLDPIMRYFGWTHLKDEKLRNVSQRFAELAMEVTHSCPPGPERSVALRKLLEGKDAAVRACLPPLPKEG